jgi:hypothetical protein
LFSSHRLLVPFQSVFLATSTTMSAYPTEKDTYTPAGPPGYAGQQFAPGAAPVQGSFTPQPQGVPQPGFAPAPYGSPQPMGSPGQQPIYSPQVVVATPMMMGGRVQNLSQFAAPCLCPNCGQTQVTRVNYQAGSHTHLWAVILGVLACCCCIPYMVDGLKDVHHSCGNCGIPLAVWHRSGGLEVLAHQGAAGAAGAVPLQPQQTGAQPISPQYTGQPLQPQFTGAQPAVGSPPAQYVGQQPTYNGPAHV